MAFWLAEFEPFTTAVIGNGAPPASALSLQLLRKMKRLVCCDGALQKLLSVNVLPDVVVGDGDSMDARLLCPQSNAVPPHGDDGKTLSVKEKIPYYPDCSEEYNDLQKALKYCMANGNDGVLLMGCGGLREDHFIANLSIMAMYSGKMHLAMLTEHGVFNVFHGRGCYRSCPGMQVSVFSRNPHARLSFSGLKYPVRDRFFNWLWEGSLNEATGDEFTVESDGDEPVVVYRTKNGKREI